MKHIVEIKTKPKFFDALGGGFKEQAVALGIKNIKSVRAGRLFLLEGDLSAVQIKKIVHELLTDNVVEDCVLNYSPSKKTPAHKIELWLKNSATDVVGESVLEAVLDMNIKNIKDVRCGFVYYVDAKLTKSKLDFLARKILVNPLIHKFKVA